MLKQMLYASIILSYSFKPNIVVAQKADKPNVLIIMLDDAGLDMSAYGSTYVQTPTFDRIAKEGVLFKKAYTPNAKCAPSRACLLTGRNSWQLEAAANHYIYFPPQFKTYQEALADFGYSVGYTGKGYSPGVTLKQDGTPRDVLGTNFGRHKLLPPTPEISRDDYFANFKDFIDSVPDEKPWSFWVGIHEPHRAYAFESGEKLGNKNTNMIGKLPGYWPDSLTIRKDLLDYAYEIEYADEQAGKIVQELEKRGILNNTLIIYTSDHGMPFPRVKGNQYEQANHVPLALCWKDRILSTGRDIKNYVSFIDLTPTIFDAVELPFKESGLHPSPGKSFLPLLTAEIPEEVQASRDFVLVGKERHDTGRPNDWGYPIRGIYKDNMLYIKNFEPNRWPSGNPETGYLNVDSSPTKSLLLNLRRKGNDKNYWMTNFGKRPLEELYDITSDPYCINNLALNEEFSSQMQNLKSFMMKKLSEEGDLRIEGYGHLYEQYDLSKWRGLYDDFLAGKKPAPPWILISDIESYFLDGRGNNLKKVPDSINMGSLSGKN
ncbi:sulfatase family protein [Leeuwenhoekiella parthenopeia]|uniref:Sulfatase n=1 Tax=Leeuwenhoekiella parthenopeia TaxID=2890320 RepID=A0ABS8GRS9_9FLAO|nr:sulfatase [Leeuwenhoekiella parthenopeia]MCC4211283.1 sulfatase [Leeuwenhoekiella parthenopeia]